MSEEEKQTNEGAEKTGENQEGGAAPKEPSMVEKANQAAEVLRKENERMEENIKRQEELAAKRVLGGESDYSGEQKQEESPSEYAKKVMGGQVPQKE